MTNLTPADAHDPCDAFRRTLGHENMSASCLHGSSGAHSAELASACRAITALASRMARPSSPVRSKDSLATRAQSSFNAVVVALWVCFTASFGVHGIDEAPVVAARLAAAVHRSDGTRSD